MSISVDRIEVGANETILIRIQGSIERSILVEVSKSGRCFVTGPLNTNRVSYELTLEGMKEVTAAKRAEAMRF